MNTKYLALLSITLISTMYGWRPDHVQEFIETGRCGHLDFTNHPNFKEVIERVKKIHKKLNLTRANLEGANLSEADLSNAQLQGANLNGANLSKAILRNANLSNASATSTNFSEAVLHGAIFKKAHLINVTFNNAQFSRDSNPTHLYKAKLSKIERPTIIYVDNQKYTNPEQIKQILQAMVHTNSFYRVTFCS